MTFQLTIHPGSSSPEDSFAPGRLVTFPHPQNDPVRIGAGEHCQCRLPDGPAECLQISCGSTGKYAVESLPGCPATLNQQPLLGQPLLRSGDWLEIPGWKIRFFLLYPRAGQSWRSDALGRLTKAGIALVLAAQVLLIFILPHQLKDGNFWYGQQLRLSIVEKTDDLRRAIRNCRSSDPIVQALLAEYEQELLRRTRYLRRNTDALTRRQRTDMLTALNRIEQDILLLEKAQLVPVPPALDLDRPVKEIIENIAYE
ncbi:MAG: hypothetical protein GX564_13085 [Oligosphaeraceae bacterium]|nr:hypothetical protein [Oligosphaeraceae bacterium]